MRFKEGRGASTPVGHTRCERSRVQERKVVRSPRKRVNAPLDYSDSFGIPSVRSADLTRFGIDHTSPEVLARLGIGAVHEAPFHPPRHQRSIGVPDNSISLLARRIR